MPSTDRPVVLQLRKTTWVICGVLLVAPWVALMLTLRSRSVPSSAAIAAPAAITPAQPSAPATGPGVTRCRPGPWGELEYYPILLEPPEQFIVSDHTTTSPLRWTFKGYTEASLTALWQAAALSPSQMKELSEPDHHRAIADGIEITPTRDLVIALSPEARSKIYTALAAFPENSPQFTPYRLRTDMAATWLDDSDLSPETIALTRRMFYRRGIDAVFFSDDDIVLPTLATTGERVKLIKTLSRKSALFVQLRVRPGMEVEPVVQYWGFNRRAKDLRPLLQSLARRPEGATLDVVHLLPMFARALLYTFPMPAAPALQEKHDCHWTSFNFFNEQPSEKFSRIETVAETLKTDYYPVPGEPAYGDILMFVRPDNVVVHSCVYLADDLVFTKNGFDFSIPWQISTVDGVTAFYSLNNPGLTVRRYRLNTR